jgi:hypothetical protein
MLGYIDMKTQPQDPLIITLEKMDARYTKLGGKRYKELGTGSYSLRLKVTSNNETVYIPASIGSGRVSTGLVYTIEGSEKGKAVAQVDCRGEGVVVVTSGSISYWKIPAGKIAQVKLYFQVKVPRQGTYKVVISRINYKLNTNDSRYKRFLTDISSKTLKFS